MPSCGFATATLSAVDVRDDPQLRTMVNWLVELAQPEELILFGSRSRGEERLDSDADFLVVLPVGTTKEAIDALLLAVPKFNETSPIELELHPRSSDVLCGELRMGLPATTLNAMRDGILLYPSDRARSRYKRFADAAILAHRVKLWLYPALEDLYQLRQIERAVGIVAAVKLARKAVDEALHALLVCVGGDIPYGESPSAVLEEIAAFNCSVVKPLHRVADDLDRVVALADRGPETTLDEALARQLLTSTAALVRFARRATREVAEPDIPCRDEE